MDIGLVFLLLLCRNDVRVGWVGVDNKLAEMEKFPIDPINQDSHHRLLRRVAAGNSCPLCIVL